MHYFALKFNKGPERAFVAPPSGGFVGGPEYVTKTILFEQGGQNMHILLMNFNKSYVARISPMLHRCAGVTIPMVS